MINQTISTDWISVPYHAHQQIKGVKADAGRTVLPKLNWRLAVTLQIKQPEDIVTLLANSNVFICAILMELLIDWFTVGYGYCWHEPKYTKEKVSLNSF